MDPFERMRLGLLFAPDDGGGGGGDDAGDAVGKDDDASDDKGGSDDAGGDDTDDKGGDEEELDPRAKAKIQKVNREAANLRKRLREMEPLAQKAKDLEEANKTAEQKLEERATTAETEAKSSKTETLKLRVALRKGLTETQAKRLVGDSEEELEKDADELLESFKPDDDKGDQESRRRPQERLRPGAAPGANSEPSDPAELAKQVPRV